MEDLLQQLDAPARRALDVALAAAAAINDRHCGTEYLLFGLFSGGVGEMSEIAELFVLDGLRIERAIHKVREPFLLPGLAYDGDPQLSLRAAAALRTTRYDGTGPTGLFEVLYGALEDPRSGASTVLRELGVRPEEVRRLAAYGRRHLTRDEAAQLFEALDRRETSGFQPWWGPREPLHEADFDGQKALELGRSVSAVARASRLAFGADGLAISLQVESLRDWVLPPVLDPPEILTPGFAAKRRIGPELLRFEMVFADGTRVSNMHATERWSRQRPSRAALVPMEHDSRLVRANDRRQADYRVVEARWWVWPLPPAGTIELRVYWPAEVLSGLAAFDARRALAARQAS